MNTNTPHRPSLTLVKQYNATKEQVWQAWTQAEALKQWFHPAPDMETPVAEVDLRVGGAWHLKILTDDCEDNDVKGIYK